MFEFREIKSETEYKLLELRPDAPFTQAWFFGEWQKKMGRKVRRFEAKNDTETIGFFQAIVYPLVFSKKFIYIPHAPILRQGFGWQAEFLREFRKKLVEIGKEENATFVRFDPVVNFDNAFAKGGRVSAVSGQSSTTGFDLYFRKVPDYAYHSSYFQPKFEWILDLGKSEEEILSGMHPKTRYNINLAQRKGIGIEIVNSDFIRYFDDFYKLLGKTAKRDDFNLHPKIYYENIFRNLNPDSAFLVVARYNNKILIANLNLLFGETTYFLYGGSSDEYKNLMASHLAHWRGILEAKRRNYKIYNFGGVDVDGTYEKYGGISVFKKRFGGKLLEYSDSYDLVLKPLWYHLYNLRKKIF